jgi:ABC-2 family transporter protein
LLRGSISKSICLSKQVVIGFPFIGGAFGSFVVQEKSSKAKHLQTVAGVQPSAYWLSTFLWDVMNYQIPLWIVVALMFIFDIDILTTHSRDIFSGVVTILFLFGPALAGFTYCMSFAFKSASMCNVFVISSGFLIGLGGRFCRLFLLHERVVRFASNTHLYRASGPLTCTVLMLLARDPRNPNPSLIGVADVVTWVLRFTPFFCFGKGLFNAINIDLFMYLEEDDALTAWTEPVMLYEVYFLAGQAIFFVVLAIHLDQWSTK